jgi:predicted HicB family RNase H-like nuclease
MKPHVQIVGRVPLDVKRRLVAAAKRRRLSLNAYLIETLTQAVGSPRPSVTAKEST